MKDYTRIIYIAAPLILVLALVLWNWDWSPENTGGGSTENSAPVRPRDGMSSISTLGAPVQEEDASVPQAGDGPFAGLTFRNFGHGWNERLKFDISEIDALAFMEGNRVAAIVENALVMGTYTVMETGVSITLREGSLVADYNLVYDVAAQVLLGPAEERYDLRGGQNDAALAKRRRATKVVNDARIYEAAIDQWAIENGKINTDTFAFSNVSDYIKSSSELVRTSGKDVLGNPYRIGTVMEGVHVSPVSYQQLTDVTSPDFWSSYAPQ